jgi:hypothetical protein
MKVESIPQVGCSAYVAVVQLEERFPAKEEVIGSNPIGYTIVDKSELQFATFGLLKLFFGSTNVVKLPNSIFYLYCRNNNLLMTKVGLIGYGSIGQELARQITEKGWDISWIVTRETIKDNE